jgi:hypothetical protein
LNSQQQPKLKGSCPRCGQNDHQRSTSQKCKFYKPHTNKTPKNNKKKGNKPPSTHGVQQSSSSSSLVASKEATPLPPLPEPIEPAPSISTPTYIYVGKKETEKEALLRYKPVVDVSSSNFKPAPTVFKVFGKDERNRSVELVPTPELLCTKYYTQKFILSIVSHSNRYINDKKKKFRTLIFGNQIGRKWLGISLLLVFTNLLRLFTTWV